MKNAVRKTMKEKMKGRAGRKSRKVGQEGKSER